MALTYFNRGTQFYVVETITQASQDFEIVGIFSDPVEAQNAAEGIRAEFEGLPAVVQKAGFDYIVEQLTKRRLGVLYEKLAGPAQSSEPKVIKLDHGKLYVSTLLKKEDGTCETVVECFLYDVEEMTIEVKGHKDEHS